MWTIVCFVEDNSVEAVPSFWLKNGLCAWPKKNVRKCVLRRTNPNIIEFNYFKARAIFQHIETFQEARAKLVRAEETSELSSHDNDKSTRQKRHKKNQLTDDDDDKQNIVHKPKKRLNSSQSIIKDPPTFHSNDVDFFSDAECSEDNDDIDKDKNYVPSTLQTCNTINDAHEDIENISVIDSPSGKWSVTNTQEVYTSSRRKKLDFSHTLSATSDYKKPSSSSFKKSFPGSDSPGSQHIIENKFKQSVNLTRSSSSSSPPVNSPGSSFNIKCNGTDQNNSQIKKQQQGADKMTMLLDIAHQLMRSTSNLRFEVREMAKKIDAVEAKISECISHSNAVVYENNDVNEPLWDLPLKTIEDLELFEEKLSDQVFRKKMISELSRYERSTISETTRQITSIIFHNKLLEQFLYKGQKHKRVFSVLNSCALIFSTVRSIKKYNCCPDMDISKPLKAYMANSKAREEKKQIKLALQ